MDAVRCPSCNLVQFKSEKCRRCKKVSGVSGDPARACNGAKSMSREWIPDKRVPDHKHGGWKSPILHGRISARIGVNVKRLRKRRA